MDGPTPAADPVSGEGTLPQEHAPEAAPEGEVPAPETAPAVEVVPQPEAAADPAAV